MTASVHIEGKRWSLLQALAWVMTRDEELTAAAAPDAPDGYPRDPLWLIAQTAPAGTVIGVSDAWRSLAEEIVCGRVAADGRPDRADGQLADRRPLTIEARDLRLNGERQVPGRYCYLASTSIAQRSWFNVELAESSVVRIFPAIELVTQPQMCEPLSVGAGKQVAVQNAVAELWPNGVPPGYPAKSRDGDIIDLLKSRGISVSGPTIRRSLSAADRK